MARLLVTFALLLLPACSESPDVGPLQVSLIGGTDEAGALLRTNTMQGPVALDEEGEIEPALAQRWTVLDDGSFIFRIGDHRWNDGTALTAEQIARRLREARRTDDPVAPLLADIAEINAITPYILELTLARPRPDLLRLLALPRLGMGREGEGLGPLALAEGYNADDDRLLLMPRRAPPDPDDESVKEDVLPPAPADTIEVRVSRPALAVARYRLGAVSLVLGGDWTTLPYARAIDPQQALAVDPAVGLFGLAFVEEDGFLGDPENRQLLSLAIDRDRIADALGQPEARPSASILPADTAGLPSPVAPPWQGAAFGARRDFARNAVERWKAENGPVEPLRIALPDAAGSALIFALIEADWRAIGIEAVRVPWEDDADLRLIDRIAPSDRAGWYLHFFRCAAPYPCSEAYTEALEALAEAQTPRVYAIRATEAARALEAAAPFIPLLQPIRWSLVRPGLGGFTVNRFASHPLSPILAARR